MRSKEEHIESLPSYDLLKRGGFLMPALGWSCYPLNHHYRIQGSVLTDSTEREARFRRTAPNGRHDLDMRRGEI